MFKPFFESCQELIFPSFCLSCDTRLACSDLPLLCSDCLARVAPVNSPICSCCGLPFEAGNNHYCGLCLKQTYAFGLARAATYYEEPIAPLISALKFNGSLAGLSTLAQLANDSPGINDLSKPDIIIPVPLHTKRLRERKFNQASLIARTCFPDHTNRIDVDVVSRVKATPPQTGLSGKERRKNLSGAFLLKDQEKIKNKNILIVDDVFTTGQTVHECAKVLRKFGAKRIEVFTLARAL